MLFERQKNSPSIEGLSNDQTPFLSPYFFENDPTIEIIKPNHYKKNSLSYILSPGSFWIYKPTFIISNLWKLLIMPEIDVTKRNIEYNYKFL